MFAKKPQFIHFQKDHTRIEQQKWLDALPSKIDHVLLILHWHLLQALAIARIIFKNQEIYKRV